MASANSEHARSFLSSVPSDKVFWCANGAQFKSLEELAKSLYKLRREDFSHHVSAEKNDFANWIYDVIGDVELATKLRSVVTKKDVSTIIKSRITQLKKL